MPLRCGLVTCLLVRCSRVLPFLIQVLWVSFCSYTCNLKLPSSIVVTGNFLRTPCMAWLTLIFDFTWEIISSNSTCTSDSGSPCFSSHRYLHLKWFLILWSALFLVHWISGSRNTLCPFVQFILRNYSVTRSSPIMMSVRSWFTVCGWLPYK